MIYLFYRDTSNNKPNNLRPFYFNYERCFKNLLDTIDWQLCKLTVMFDGDKTNHYVDKYLKYYNYNIEIIKAGNDFESNTQTFKYIQNQKNIKDDDIIMIQENDYLFINEWIHCVLDLYSCIDGMNYCTLYDHNDKMICQHQERNDEWGMYKDLVSKIYCTKTRHWRTLPNTCGSFLMSKTLFNEDFDIHTNNLADNSRFYFLNKNRNRIVLSPIPSLSTHLQVPWMAPIINWYYINENVKLL